eukprot:gene6250-9583_t
MSGPEDRPLNEEDAPTESDMDEVVDMDELRQMEADGMVKFHEGDGQAPLEDDDDEMDAAMDEDAAPVAEMATEIFGGHTKPVHAVAVHPSGKWLASGGEDDKVFLWPIDSGRRAVIPPATEENDFMTKHCADLPGHTDTVVAVSFSADGTLLATAGMDGRVMIFEVEPATHRATMEELGDAVTYMFWHPKGNVVFAGSADSQSAMWNEKGACLQVFAGHASEVTCGALVGDNKLLATGSDDQAVKIFSPKTGEQVAHFDTRGKGMYGLPSTVVTAVAAHPVNHDTIVCGYDDGSVAILSIATKKVFSVTPGLHAGAVECISLSSKLPYFTTCCAVEGTLVFWNGESNSVRDSVKQEAGFTATKWMGDYLYATDTNGCVRRYDGKSASEAPSI